MEGDTSSNHIDKIRESIDVILNTLKVSQKELKLYLPSIQKEEQDCHEIQTQYCTLIQEKMEFANTLSECITNLIERHDQNEEWRNIMDKGIFETIKGERKKILEELISRPSLDMDLFSFLHDEQGLSSNILSSLDPIKKWNFGIGRFKGIGTSCSDSSSSMSSDSSSSSSSSSMSSDSSSSSSSDSSMSSDSGSSSSEFSFFAPSKELYYLPSTKQLFKQFEKEERENNVNIIIVFTVVLGHFIIEINHHLQNLYSFVKEDDEESKDNESISIDNEDKDGMSLISVDIGLEVFAKNINSAMYPASITIPKSITVPVKRSLMMEFDDESLS